MLQRLLTLDLWPFRLSTIPLAGYTKVIPISSLNSLGSFVLRASDIPDDIPIDIPILSVRLSVCLSVCLSVTRWYCIKTAEHIVMLSSPHDSPFILVLCISISSRNSDGAAKQRWGVKMSQFSTNNLLPIYQKWLKIGLDGYMQRGVLQALNPLPNRVTFTAIVLGAYQGESKMWNKTLSHSKTVDKNLAIANRSRVSCINTNNNTMTLKSGL